MNRKVFIPLELCVAVVWPNFLRAQSSATLTTLISFNGTNGASPGAGLVLGKDGNFYGTTEFGGANPGPDGQGFGTVFRMLPDGTLTTLVSFNGADGYHSVAELVQGSDGNFYGTTLYGGTNSFLFDTGAGNIFQVTPSGTLNSLVLFNNNNGAYPQGALTIGNDGNFYGTTELGGAFADTNGNGYGTIFEMTPGGALTTLVSFNGNDGGEPYAELLLGSDGNFYGTTIEGGTNGGHGTIFQYAPGGALKTLFSFNGANGAAPNAGLIQAPDGSLYGTTELGGTNTTDGILNDGSIHGYGTLFRLAPNGKLTTMVYFNGTNGAYPLAKLLLGKDGNIYGTTAGYPPYAGDGTIFQLTPTGTFTTLAAFDGDNGSQPYGGLVIGNDGNFYGTTYSGGASGQGTVFQLSNPATPVLQTITTSGGRINFTWNSVIGSKYQVQFSTSLNPAGWSNLGSVITATSGTTTASDAITSTERFYRVLVVP